MKGISSLRNREGVPVADDRSTSLLEELVAWTRFAHRESLVRAIRDTMKDPRHLAVFEQLDGTVLQTKIATESGLSKQQISTLVAKWRRLGLVRELHGKTVHIARPSDLGIPVEKLRSADPSSS